MRGTRGAVRGEACVRACDRLHGAAQPCIAEARRTVDRDVSHAGHPQRRVGLLHRPRVHGERGERPEAALICRVLVLPYEPQDREGFLHAGAALAEIRTVHVVLEVPPSAADAERRTSARDLVERGDLLGDSNRIVNRQLEDAGPHPQCGGTRRDRREEGERIAHVAG